MMAEKQGPRPVISIRRSVRGAAGGGGQGGRGTPRLRSSSSTSPTPGFIGTPSVSIRALGAGGTGRHKCVLGKLRPKEIFHFLKNVGTVLAHELQIGFSHLGPAHFPADGQPGLLGETLGVEQHPVYIKDKSLYFSQIIVYTTHVEPPYVYFG